jgi:hypothetical protein
VDARRDNAELGLRPRLNDSRAVRTDEGNARLFEDIFDLDHVMLRNVLRDADDQPNTCMRCFDHRSGGGRRWDENERCIRTSLGNTLGNGRVNGKSRDCLTRFLSVDPTNNFRAILSHQSAVELTLLPEALDKNFRLLVDEEEWLVERGAAQKADSEHVAKVKWSNVSQFSGVAEWSE